MNFFNISKQKKVFDGLEEFKLLYDSTNDYQRGEDKCDSTFK
jgi:hypothetical protein